MAVPNPTHYDILGVEPDASTEGLRAAYKEAARRAHPDRGGSHAAMRAVNAAWEVLSDPDSRRRYDEDIGVGQSQPPGPDSTDGSDEDGPAGDTGGSRERDDGGWPAPPVFPASDSRLIATAQTVRWTFLAGFWVVANLIWPFWKVAGLLVLVTAPVSILTSMFGVGSLGQHLFWGVTGFVLLTVVPATVVATAAGTIMGAGVGSIHLVSWLRKQPKRDLEAEPILLATSMIDTEPDYRWPTTRRR